jgi:flagellar hook assembly protein FlgD
MTTDVSPLKSEMPETLELKSAYPNPFNAEVVISYFLETNERVTLSIYDIRGTKIRTLFCGVQNPGHYAFQWDAQDDDGVSVASGLYIFQLTAGARTLSDKITLLK